jgi:hypothetical protein
MKCRLRANFDSISAANIVSEVLENLQDQLRTDFILEWAEQDIRGGYLIIETENAHDAFLFLFLIPEAFLLEAAA